MATLTKLCEVCGATIVKPPTCSMANWPKRRFCSQACKRQSQIGQPSVLRGRSYGPSMAQRLPCRVCGEPTRYHGIPSNPRAALVRCDRQDCRDESRAKKNQRIAERAKSMYASGERPRLIGNWQRVRTVSAEEEALAPWFKSIGWTPQYRFVPGTNQRSFRLDFADSERRLDVEIDGTSHRFPERQRRDAARDATLIAGGWRVLRIQAKDVQADAESVRARILAWIAE